MVATKENFINAVEPGNLQLFQSSLYSCFLKFINKGQEGGHKEAFSRQEYWSGLPLPSCKTPLVDRYSCTVAINETQIPELHVLPIIELFPQYCMHLSFKIYFLTAVAISLVFPVNLT